MNEKWENVFGEVPASFEERMRATLASLEEKPKVRRFRFPAGGLIAAVLMIAVLGATALATDLFGLRSLTVTDPYATPEATGVVIALQGLPESPEFKANAAWMDYLAGLDLEASAAKAEADGGSVPAGYELYTVYDRDMADKLDAIAAENGLRLHTSARDFFSESELYAILGTEPFIADCAALSGTVYEDGSFQAAGTCVADKCYEYELGLYRKGSFSQVTLNIGDADGYKEWIYTTSSGVDVQLSMSPDRCVLLADLPDAFVAVNLLGGTAGNSVFMPEPVTAEDLQAFAEQFDFSALQ